MEMLIKKPLSLLVMLLLICTICTASVHVQPHTNHYIMTAEKVDVITLPVPHFKQCGESYSANMLGSCSGSTICSDGCALCMSCSILSANGASLNGSPVSPGALNTYLKYSNGYSNGCILRWDVACSIPTSTVSFEGTKPYLLSTINAKLNAHSPVICYVQIPQDHFIVVVGMDGDPTVASSYIVQDPLYSTQRRLSQYNVINLRVFSDNVINPQGVTGFKINNYDLTPNFIVWKSPPYQVKFHWENYSSGYIYKILLARGGVETASIMTNLSTADTSFQFQVPANSSNFPVGSNYQFWISPMGPTNPVYQSPMFTIQKLPPMNVEFLNGGVVSAGQNVSIRITFPEGLLGATGNLTAQPYVNNVADTNLASFPINQSQYSFTVRGSWIGKTVKIGVSNSMAPSNIPIGYLFAYSGVFNVTTTEIKNEESGIPSTYKLEQNYPNPFNPETRIKFSVPADTRGDVKLILFDLSGKELKSILNQNLRPGYYSVALNMNEFGSGVYFYKLLSSSYQETKKLLFIK